MAAVFANNTTVTRADGQAVIEMIGHVRPGQARGGRQGKDNKAGNVIVSSKHDRGLTIRVSVGPFISRVSAKNNTEGKKHQRSLSNHTIFVVTSYLYPGAFWQGPVRVSESLFRHESKFTLPCYIPDYCCTKGTTSN